MKLKYTIIILSVSLGVLFLLAQSFSNFVTAGPEEASLFEMLLYILFEPLTTNVGLFFVLTVLILCFMFGVFLSYLTDQVMKAKDATEQMSIEKSTILEAVPEILIYFDKDLIIEWVSDSLYLTADLKESDVIGRSILDMGRMLYSSDMVDTIFEEFLEDEKVNIETKRLDGSYWRLIINTSKDADGEVIGHVLLAIDITASKHDEKMKRISYERLEANIAQFATIIDNIRNPLSSIVLLAEMSNDQDASEKIILKCDKIEEVIAKLDKDWAESEEIRNFLKKYP